MRISKAKLKDGQLHVELEDVEKGSPIWGGCNAMTLTAISNTIARAILATIERDGICNLQNIEEAVFRELAVAEARVKQEEKPAEAAPVNDDIRRCAHELVQMMLADAAQRGPNYYSSRVAMAHHHLCEALRK